MKKLLRLIFSIEKSKTYTIFCVLCFRFTYENKFVKFQRKQAIQIQNSYDLAPLKNAQKLIVF